MVEKKPNDALRKLAQAEDAKKARAEYDAAANTARLRALRLEREAAAASAAAEAKPVKKKAAAKKTKAPAAKLSEWLQDQKGSGRNN
jgi:hypothetical protein